MREAAPGDWDRIVAMVDHTRVVALGETGLDRYWDFTPFDVQQDYFDRHLSLGQQRDLPVVIHCRDCDDDVVAMLREASRRGPVRGLIHAFSGSAAMAEECLAMGLSVSFAGMVSYRNKKFQPLRAVAAGIDADRLLLETDSPYLVPHPLRGNSSATSRPKSSTRPRRWPSCAASRSRSCPPKPPPTPGGCFGLS